MVRRSVTHLCPHELVFPDGSSSQPIQCWLPSEQPLLLRFRGTARRGRRRWRLVWACATTASCTMVSAGPPPPPLLRASTASSAHATQCLSIEGLCFGLPCSQVAWCFPPTSALLPAGPLLAPLSEKLFSSSWVATVCPAWCRIVVQKGKHSGGLGLRVEHVCVQ